MQDLVLQDLFEHLKNLSYSPYIHFFFWLMVLDIITGYIKAFKTKRFDSKIGTMGLIRHFIVFAVILLVAMYSRSLGVRSFGIAWTMFLGDDWVSISRVFETIHQPN